MGVRLALTRSLAMRMCRRTLVTQRSSLAPRAAASAHARPRRGANRNSTDPCATPSCVPSIHKRVKYVADLAARKTGRSERRTGRALSAADAAVMVAAAASDLSTFRVEHILGGRDDEAPGGADVPGLTVRTAALGGGGSGGGRSKKRPPRGAVLVVSDQLEGRSVARAMGAAPGVSMVVPDTVVSVAVAPPPAVQGARKAWRWLRWGWPRGLLCVNAGWARCSAPTRVHTPRRSSAMSPRRSDTSLSHIALTRHAQPPRPRAVSRRPTWPAPWPLPRASTGPAAGSPASPRSRGSVSAATAT